MRILTILLTLLTVWLGGCATYDCETIKFTDVSVIHHGGLRYTVFATTTDRYEALKLAKKRAKRVCHSHHDKPKYINIKTGPDTQDIWQRKMKAYQQVRNQKPPKMPETLYLESQDRKIMLTRVLVDFQCTDVKSDHSG